jgi:DNA-binding CsgD family transcriptional regulator
MLSKGGSGVSKRADVRRTVSVGRRTSVAKHGARGGDRFARHVLAIYSCATFDDFLHEAFRLLPTVVRCDLVSAFFRPAGERFLKEHDSLGRVWDGHFMRRYTELTPAIPLVVNNPGVRLITTRSALAGSDEELHRTAFYREVMRPQGWRHGVALCFWTDPPGQFPIMVLTSYRVEGRPDFSDFDLRCLEQVYPLLARAVTRFYQTAKSDSIADGIATTLRSSERGIVVLDCDLRIVRTNIEGHRRCTTWDTGPLRHTVGAQRGAVCVPNPILRACQELRRELQSVMRQNPDAHAMRKRIVADPMGMRSPAVVTVVCPTSPIAQPSFVIEFETRPDRPTEEADDSVSERLTNAEMEVALAVATGMSNDECAERLGKSIHAVKFLLHRVYRKLDVPNRARLGLLLRGKSSHASGPRTSPTPEPRH